MKELDPERDDPNAYLEVGWTLVAAYPSCVDRDYPTDQRMHYAVGWAAGGNPVEPERPKFDLGLD